MAHSARYPQPPRGTPAALPLAFISVGELNHIPWGDGKRRSRVATALRVRSGALTRLALGRESRTGAGIVLAGAGIGDQFG